MKDFPFFKLYTTNFLIDTAMMSDSEVGAYIRNIVIGWTKGKCDCIWVSEQIDFAKKLSEIRSESVKKRWEKSKENKNLDTNVKQLNYNSNTDRREKKRKEEKRINTPYSPEFLEFWELYPPQRREGKLKAFKSWQTLKPDLEQIKTALAWQKKSDQWTKDGGQFIPMPASYLNGKRWEDSPKTPLAQKEAYRWPTEAEIDRIGRGYDFSDTKIASLVGFTKISDPNMIGSKKTAIEIVLMLGRQFDKEPDRFLIYAD